ncbi:hypothetical protein P3L10_009558 [Capsicum annuum]
MEGKVLAKCHLKEVVKELENGLDSLVPEDGLKWSMGNLRTGFMNSIVITINRIPIVMDGTMVLAISDGELVEYDEPIVFNMYGGSVNEKWRENGGGKETLI